MNNLNKLKTPGSGEHESPLRAAFQAALRNTSRKTPVSGYVFFALTTRAGIKRG